MKISNVVHLLCTFGPPHFAFFHVLQENYLMLHLNNVTDHLPLLHGVESRVDARKRTLQRTSSVFKTLGRITATKLTVCVTYWEQIK
jgi:hypothetical protein